MNQESKEPFVSSHVMDSGILVLKLNGKLDGASTSQFNDEVEKQFQEGRQKFVIDCSKLSYVSSFGIGALVSLQAKLRMQGGEVKLAAIQSMVADIFRIVRLDRLLETYKDVESAIESFDQ